VAFRTTVVLSHLYVPEKMEDFDALGAKEMPRIGLDESEALGEGN
jgi:hypothetical protein